MLLKILSIFLFSFFTIVSSVIGQKSKKLQLEANGSVDFAVNEGYLLPGSGSQIKLLIPVGIRNSALVTSIGIDMLYEEFAFDSYTYNFMLASFGYRKRIKSAFIEPKIGLGFNIEDGYQSPCGFVGLEPGIEKKKLTFSIDYRFISSDGIADGDYFHTIGLKVGYKIL